MSRLPIVNPGRVGILADGYARACDAAAELVASGVSPGAAVCMGRRGAIAPPSLHGVPEDALFLVASITKPIVAAGAMLLIERGRLGLDDRVVEYLPEFAGDERKEVCIRHLLTHTSGLPDQLPENYELRAAGADLATFVAHTCRHPLLFPPGTRVQYQSMGFALLAAIVERITGAPLRELLRRELFEPLGMHDTSLGRDPRNADRISRLFVEPEQEGRHWNWNSDYWLDFGAPWGGLITSPFDLARFCRMMLDLGSFGRERVLSPASVRAMTRNQLEGMPDVPEEDRRCRPWGLGWLLNRPAKSANFGDLLGPNSYGHWGATGTLCWIDPDADAFGIVFLNRPDGIEGRNLQRMSNRLAAALA